MYQSIECKHMCCIDRVIENSKDIRRNYRKEFDVVNMAWQIKPDNPISKILYFFREHDGFSSVKDGIGIVTLDEV